MPTTARPPRLLLALLVTSVVAIGACSAGAAPPTSSGPIATPSADHSAPGSAPGSGSEPGAGGGGGSAGDPGTGAGGGPVDPHPIDPGAGGATIVIPMPGRQDPHPVAPQAVQASVDGRHVLVKVIWYGGVAPCSVLDSVRVERSGTDIAITVIEGSSDPKAICVDLAMLKATIVDLGDLEPGTWTIRATNSDAAPITVTIG